MKHAYFFLLVIIVNIIRLSLSVYIELPELSLILLFIYASVIGRVAGGGMALLTGIIQDILIGRVIGIYAVSYLVAVYFIGWMTSHKYVVGNLLNIFSVFIIGSALFELSYWLLAQVSFDAELSILTVLNFRVWLLIVLQGIFGIVLYSRIKGLISKSGFLFKY